MKPVKPWRAGTECPLPGYAEFKEDLNLASYHNAAEGRGEAGHARSATRAAAEVAIEHEWPYWAMERMFREIGPLVTWGDFMQTYINILSEKITESA